MPLNVKLAAVLSVGAVVKFKVPDAFVTPAVLAVISEPPAFKRKVSLALAVPLIVCVPAFNVPFTVIVGLADEFPAASLMAFAPESDEASKVTPALMVTPILGVVPAATVEMSPEPVQLPFAANTML